jgi:hypothetical protein
VEAKAEAEDEDLPAAWAAERIRMSLARVDRPSSSGQVQRLPMLSQFGQVLGGVPPHLDLAKRH